MMESKGVNYGSTFVIHDQEVERSPRKKGSRWIMCAVIAIILLLAVAMILFYVLRDSNGDNERHANALKSKGINEPSDNSLNVPTNGESIITNTPDILPSESSSTMPSTSMPLTVTDPSNSLTTSSTVAATSGSSTTTKNNPINLPPNKTDEEDVNLYNLTQRYFPQDFDQALSSCNKRKGGCICGTCIINKSKVKEYRKNLNLTKDEVQKSQKKHFPWGLPMSTEPTEDLLLTQQHYVIGYSPRLHLPLFVGYRITKQQIEGKLKYAACFRKDIRLRVNESPQCGWYYKSGYNVGRLAVSSHFRHFGSKYQQDLFMLTNAVPQKSYFSKKGAWEVITSITRELLKTHNKIHVIFGTIFDANNDGIKDAVDEKKSWLKGKNGTVAIPTHFYEIVTTCTDDSNEDILGCKNLKVGSYVIPNVVKNKGPLVEYIRKHLVTLGHVEKLTGLRFFSKFPSSISARLREEKTAIL